ncbi:Uncharacterized protein AB751O23_AJ_00220 [Chlamydiales bacterium SCGC AB-751-O23]|nr:Uncharacterized protein AB751O23_AJ_00220 [Chlamydiales bacterium SCGC AB-751-O23]
MLESKFSNLDYLSILLYFLALAMIALKFRFLKQSKAVEYFVASRKLTLPMFVGTMVATWYGQVAGISELSFNAGIFNWLTQALFWYGIYIFFAIFVAGKLQEQELWTLPQYIGRFYGKKAGFLAAWINFFKMIPIVYLLSLALLIRTFFNVDLPIAFLLGGVVSIFYCISGGYRAVVYSDCFQMLLMYIAIILVPFYAYHLYGGVSFLKANLPSEHLNLSGGFSFSETLVWAIIPLTTLVNPTFFQRCHSARNPKVAKKGILICLLFWGVFDICTTLIGLYARAIIPNVDPKDAIVTLGLTLLPSGLKGVFLIGLMATVMSTIDSHCFVAGQIFSQDIYPKIFKSKISESKMIRLSKWGMFISIALAILINSYLSFSITFYRKLTGSLGTVCLLLPLLFALFSKQKPIKNAGYYSMLFGMFGLLWFFLIQCSSSLPLLGELFPYLIIYPKQIAPFLFSEGIYVGLFFSGLAFMWAWVKREIFKEKNADGCKGS